MLTIFFPLSIWSFSLDLAVSINEINVSDREGGGGGRVSHNICSLADVHCTEAPAGFHCKNVLRWLNDETKWNLETRLWERFQTMKTSSNNTFSPEML